MLRKLTMLALSLLATGAWAETDYPSKAEMKDVQKRLAALETVGTMRVQRDPGGAWAEIPGWRFLDLGVTGTASITMSELAGGRVRLTFGASTGLSSVSATNGVLGTGLPGDPLELDLSYIPAAGVTNLGAGLSGSGITNPLSVSLDVGDGLSGSGTTNPLSVSLDVGFGLSGSGTTNPLVLDLPAASRHDGAAVALQGGALTSAYVSLPSIDWDDWMSEVALGSRTCTVPGQLVRDVSVNKTYQLKALIDHSLYAPAIATNPLPAFADTAWWGYFVGDGDDGAQGIPGVNGTNGAAGYGNVQLSAWDQYSVYAYNAETQQVVEWAGSWWRCINSSTGMNPTLTSGYWTQSVARGESGEIIGSSNFVYRGAWSIVTAYKTNDAVTRSGSLFVVSTNQESTGQFPLVNADYTGGDNAYWHCLVSSGPRGYTGLKGDDGTSITNLFLTSVATNCAVTNDPSTTNDVLWFDRADGGTNYLRWAPGNVDGVARASALGVGAAFTNVHAAFTNEVTNKFAAAVSNLLAASDGLHSTSPAIVANNQATVHLESNCWFTLDAASGITNLVAVTNGAAPSDVLAFALEIYNATNAVNTWGWGGMQFLGVTNPVSTNAFFVVVKPSVLATWQAY